MVTVEVDPVRVESRLAAGEIGCPACSAGCWAAGGMPVLGGSRGWPIRCGRGGPDAESCRGDACVVAGDGVAAQSVCGGADLGGVDGPRRRGRASPDRRSAGGAGGDGAGLAAPGWRGGWRRSGRGSSRSRCAPGWTWRSRTGSGCPWRDVLAAVATATAAITFRFGPAGLLGAVTPARVAVAAQRWSAARAGLAAGRAGRGCNTSRP